MDQTTDNSNQTPSSSPSPIAETPVSNEQPKPIPSNLVVDTPGSSDFPGTSQKKFPTVLVIVVVVVLILLIGGWVLYSNQSSPLNNLSNTPTEGLNPGSQAPLTSDMDEDEILQNEVNSILIEDVEADFTEVDKDVQSL